MGVGRTFERNGVWYYAWSHRGRETRRTTGPNGSQRMAEKLLKAKLLLLGQGADPTRDRVTLSGMVETLKLASKDRKTDDIDQRAKHLQRVLGSLYASEIGDLRILRYKERRQEEGAMPATINRELATLRRAMKVSKIWPMPEFKLLKENNARRDFLSGPDFARVHSALPQSFKGIFSFLYLSSWRETQASLLEWRDVAGDRVTARGETTKNGEPQTLPITDEIYPIIEEARQNRRLDCPYVFHLEGKPIQFRGSKAPIRKAWQKACAAAGFSGHWIHCLRRSAVRNMINAGVDPHTAMDISGHKTPSMLERYHIITVDDQRRALEKTARHLENEQPSKVVTI